MNAKEFYEKFIAAMREENIATNEQIKKHLDQVGWTYKKIYRECESAFTELVNKGIVDRIIESEDGLIPQHEYLRIDSIGYKHRYTEISEEEAREVGLNRHFGELAIAVEHENSKHDWMDEVIKLLHVRCPLKVVISYNYCDCREEMEINKLGFIAKYMKKWLEIRLRLQTEPDLRCHFLLMQVIRVSWILMSRISERWHFILEQMRIRKQECVFRRFPARAFTLMMQT